MTHPNDSDDEADLRSVAERLEERSRGLAFLWRLTEFSRIVSAAVCFFGPWFVLVLWLFDFLKRTLAPRRYPDVLKEWYFYILLCMIFVAVALPLWRLCEWGRVRLLSKVDGGP